VHVHVISPEGEAKYWLEPIVTVAYFSGLTKRQLNQLQKVIEARKDEILKAWEKHFRA